MRPAFEWNVYRLNAAAVCVRKFFFLYSPFSSLDCLKSFVVLSAHGHRVRKGKGVQLKSEVCLLVLFTIIICHGWATKLCLCHGVVHLMNLMKFKYIPFFSFSPFIYCALCVCCFCLFSLLLLFRDVIFPPYKKNIHSVVAIFRHSIRSLALTIVSFVFYDDKNANNVIQFIENSFAYFGFNSTLISNISRISWSTLQRPIGTAIRVQNFLNFIEWNLNEAASYARLTCS